MPDVGKIPLDFPQSCTVRSFVLFSHQVQMQSNLSTESSSATRCHSSDLVHLVHDPKCSTTFGGEGATLKSAVFIALMNPYSNPVIGQCNGLEQPRMGRNLRQHNPKAKYHELDLTYQRNRFTLYLRPRKKESASLPHTSHCDDYMHDLPLVENLKPST